MLKAIHHEALCFYMFHFFNISICISISALFFIKFLPHVLFFAEFLEMIVLGWVFPQSFCPRGRGFTLSYCPGGLEFALSESSPGVCRGDGQAWKLTDT